MARYDVRPVRRFSQALSFVVDAGDDLYAWGKEIDEQFEHLILKEVGIVLGFEFAYRTTHGEPPPQSPMIEIRNGWVAT